MKAVTQYTRIQPAERINRLLAFNQRLQSNQQVNNLHRVCCFFIIKLWRILGVYVHKYVNAS